MKDKFKLISDYGIIGNTRTAALVNREAGIDWLCAPNFDNDPCLFALLDPNVGGHCKFDMPEIEATGREYIGDSAVLQTNIKCKGGRLSIIDYMPPIEGSSAGPNTGQAQIGRIIKCTQGSVDVVLKVQPSFSFRKATKIGLIVERGNVCFSHNDIEFTIEAEAAKIKAHGSAAAIYRTLKVGEDMALLLTYSQPKDLTRHGLEDVRWMKQQTLQYWTEWTAKLKYVGDYPEQVKRSAITLALCQFTPTGAIVAAPTTSLPERLQAKYNWDYRFTWLRDATFTLVSLLSLGAVDEAFQFFKFLHATNVRMLRFKTLFTIFGREPNGERKLRRLSGHKNSRPVRVGNAAADQLQLDIFGELIHCIDLLLTHTDLDEKRFSFDRDLWPLINDALDSVCKNWRKADKGIWETRSAARRFVYSQGMCWIALDRGIQIAEKHNRSVPSHWRKQLANIKREFERHAYDNKQRSFLQAYGHSALDASVLRLTLLGLISPDDERVTHTLDALRHELMPEGFLLRNKNLDGAAEGEGAFLPCSFWYADNLVLQGRVTEGREMFERLLQCGNDLGLFAEEYDPAKKIMLGNFPQAFTHVALINSAVQLAIAAHGHYSESHSIIQGNKQEAA